MKGIFVCISIYIYIHAYVRFNAFLLLKGSADFGSGVRFWGLQRDIYIYIYMYVYIHTRRDRVP